MKQHQIQGSASWVSVERQGTGQGGQGKAAGSVGIGTSKKLLLSSLTQPLAVLIHEVKEQN